ncbi:hypothetical protein ACVYBL_08145, partial [Acinetobacter baumannii]
MSKLQRSPIFLKKSKSDPIVDFPKAEIKIGNKYYDLIYAELSGDFPLGDSRQPIYKSLRPF